MASYPNFLVKALRSDARKFKQVCVCVGLEAE